MVMDESGAVKARHDYFPWGEELLTASRTGALGYQANDGVSQKFTGKERDSETGLDWFESRYYSSAQGRFTSPDEFKGGFLDAFSGQAAFQAGPLPYADISDPQTLNKYSYVRNNPLRYTDPDGHCFDPSSCGLEFAGAGSLLGGPIGGGIGAVVGVATGATIVYFGVKAVQAVQAENTSEAEQNATGASAGSSRPGTLGKPDHQQTANEEAQKMGGTREVTIPTPEGQKGSRRADAAKVENGKVTQVTQVYRPTPAGNIPKREKQAAADIEKATGVKRKMESVRPVKPPCTTGGTTCQ